MKSRSGFKHYHLKVHYFCIMTLFLPVFKKTFIMNPNPSDFCLYIGVLDVFYSYDYIVTLLYFY